jgi:hypothetical protein
MKHQESERPDISRFERALAWAFILVATVELCLVGLMQVLTPNVVSTREHPLFMGVVAVYCLLVLFVGFQLFRARESKRPKSGTVIM